MMKCSVYIAISADGYIATPDGDVSWLHTAGKQDVDMGNAQDMGFEQFISSVDCMIMGRKCMEKISSMELTDEQWPYGEIKIVVLSKRVKQPPENLQGKVEIYQGDIPDLMHSLQSQGFKHAYVDGGSTITSFLELKLVDEMTITHAPVLLGDGISLFGKLGRNIKLENAQAVAFPNDFIQIRYSVNYL